jgi:hypothetical protein
MGCPFVIRSSAIIIEESFKNKDLLDAIAAGDTLRIILDAARKLKHAQKDSTMNKDTTLPWLWKRVVKWIPWSTR